MRRHLFSLGFAFLAIAPAVAAAQGFEGQIVSQIFSKGKATELTALYKGPKSRIEMGQGQGFMLVNAPDQVMYMVMAEQKMYMKLDLKQASKEVERQQAGRPEPAPPKIEKTGKTETIAGYTCEHYLMTGDDGETTDVCAAKGIGFFGMVGGAMGPGGRPMPGGGAIPARYADLANTFKDGFQPLKVERVSGANRELLMQVKSIDKKSVDAAMMEIPAGFNEFKMPAGFKLPQMPGRKP